MQSFECNSERLHAIRLIMREFDPNVVPLACEACPSSIRRLFGIRLDSEAAFDILVTGLTSAAGPRKGQKPIVVQID